MLPCASGRTSRLCRSSSRSASSPLRRSRYFLARADGVSNCWGSATPNLDRLLYERHALHAPPDIVPCAWEQLDTATLERWAKTAEVATEHRPPPLIVGVRDSFHVRVESDHETQRRLLAMPDVKPQPLVWVHVEGIKVSHMQYA